jgi:signal transduction histidine kinase/PAS domain-containing protein
MIMSDRRTERSISTSDPLGSSDEQAPESTRTLRDVAAFLRSRRDEILTAWERSARKAAAPKGLAAPELLDELPELLDRFAAELEDRARGGPGRSLPEAAAHGVRRLAQGFSIDTVVTEYNLLRAIILVRWIDGNGSAAGLLTLDRLIDRSIQEATREFEQARDRTFGAIDRILEAAAETRDLDELLRRLLSILAETIPTVDIAAILLREGDDLHVRASIGLADGSAPDFKGRVGEGFARTIVAEGRAKHLRSASEDPLVRNPSLRATGVRALYGIPLVADDRVIGVAQIGSLTVSEFSDRDRLLLLEIAHRATAAIAERALREALAHRARQQSAIADLGLVALRADDLQSVLHEAVQLAARAFDVEYVKILELLPDRTALRLRAGVGWQPGLVGHARVQTWTDSQAGFTLLSQEPVIVADFRLETRFTAPPLLRDHGVASGMSVIIRAPGSDRTPWGVLGVHTKQPRAFAQEDVIALQAFANIIATTIARRSAEFALRRSERRLRFALEGAQIIAWEGNLLTGKLTWTLGHPGGSSIAENVSVSSYDAVLASVVPEDRPELDRKIADARENRADLRAEFRLASPGCVPRWVEAKGRVSRNAAGRAVRMFGVLVDIDARKQLEAQREQLVAQLGQQRRRLDAVLQQMPAAVLIVDAEGRVVLANRQLETIFRRPLLPQAQAREYRDWKMFHADGRPYAPEERPLARALRGEIVAGEELEVERGDGTRGFIAVSAAPIRDEASRVVAGVAIDMDITERTRTERALRMLSRLLAESIDLDAALRGLTEQCVPEIGDWCLVSMRERPDAAPESVTAAISDARAARTRELLGDGDLGEILRSNAPCFVSRVAEPMEALPPPLLEAVQRLGLSSYLSVPLTSRGQVLGALCLGMAESARVFGPTDRHTAEEMGRRAGTALDNARLYAEAVRATRLRDEILAVVAHDLRNPLNVISMAAGLLTSKLPGAADRQPERAGAHDLEDAARRCAKRIQTAVEQMTRLVCDLLDYASIEAGRLAVDLQEHDLAEVIGEALERLSPLAAKKSLKLHAELPAAAPRVRCDRGRVGQVLANLIGNAIKFTPQDGSITVRVRAEQDFAEVTVSDTGPGIAKDALPRVFDRYWHIGKAEQQGFGLGLAIAKGLVEAQRGAIRVESGEGRGATFSFTLPRGEADRG